MNSSCVSSVRQKYLTHCVVSNDRDAIWNAGLLHEVQGSGTIWRLSP